MRRAVAQVRPFRHPASEVPPVAHPTSLPAPVGGWDAVSALANMKPERAVTLDNWFPKPDAVEIRRGFKTWATGMGTGVVDTVMVYQGVTAATDRMFAVANNTIYDVSASGAASATTETSLNSNRWQWVNFTTPRSE